MSDMVQTLKDLGQTRLALMAGVSLALIAFFIFLSLRIASPTMEPLYSNLSMEDSGTIAQELDKRAVKYELRANGTQILVPAEEVLKLRVGLAQQNIPSNGSIVGYEIFDRSEALGSSNFVMNVNMLRALEGELARTIGSFQKVEQARVHLVTPKRELFTRDKQDPTASVVLKLRGGTLTKSETDAITHLVATAVPGLKPTKITIVDNQGHMLARGGDDENSAELAASNADEYRVSYETRMRKTIEDLLGQSVGSGKVKAQISAEIDFDRVVRNSETFDPEGQVARSVQSNNEKESSNDNQNAQSVSAGNNLPASQGQGGAGGNASQRTVEKGDETTNYEISKTTENHVKETGTVKKMSVAVLVDGVYSLDASGNQVYAPRSEAELKQLTSLVKSAIGFDEKRGDSVEVVNMRFTQEVETIPTERAFDWMKTDLKNIIQTLVLGGVAMLVILLIIRPLINRAIESSATAAQLAEQEKAVLAGPGLSSHSSDLALTYGGDTGPSGPSLLAGEDDEDLVAIDHLRNRGRQSNVRKITEVIDRNPDEAMNVLRQWFAPAE